MMKTPEQYAALHPKMFRVAFDFLNTHFPPEDTDEWWTKLAEDCSEASIKAGEDPLAVQLLSGVVNYINEINMQRRQDNAEAVNN